MPATQALGPFGGVRASFFGVAAVQLGCACVASVSRAPIVICAVGVLRLRVAFVDLSVKTQSLYPLPLLRMVGVACVGYVGLSAFSTKSV